MTSKVVLALFFFSILLISSLVVSSYSIVILSPKIDKIISYQQVTNNSVCSNPNWINGTAIVERNITYESIIGLTYSYAVQYVNFENFTNFSYSARYSYFSGSLAGPIILGGNVKLNKPANEQQYVLIYSVVTGQLLIKTPNSSLRVIMNNLPISVNGLVSIQFSNVEGNLTVDTIELNGNVTRLIYITPIPWSKIKYVGWLQNYGFSTLYYLSSLYSVVQTIPMIAGQTYMESNVVSSPNWNLGVAKITSLTDNYEVVKGSQEGSYVVQFYNISHLNYLILSVNFTYYNGSNAGVELLGSNLNLHLLDTTQKIYGLLYAVNNGYLYIRSPMSNWQIINTSLPVIKSGLLTLVFLNVSNNVSLYEIITNNAIYYLNITTKVPWSNITYIGWRVDNGTSNIYFLPQNFVVGVQANLVFEFIGNNGTAIPKQEFYIYLGSNISNLQFYYKGYTDANGLYSIPLPIIYSMNGEYEYVRIAWINASTNVTLIIPLIRVPGQLSIPLSTITIGEENPIDISINYMDYYILFLFIVLAVLLAAYVFRERRF